MGKLNRRKIARLIKQQAPAIPFIWRHKLAKIKDVNGYWDAATLRGIEGVSEVSHVTYCKCCGPCAIRFTLAHNNTRVQCEVELYKEKIFAQKQEQV